MDFADYVRALDLRYQRGIAREHAYRGDLQNLLEGLLPDVAVTNEPARIACGAPDYILTVPSTGVPIGYVEAKDIGKSLDGSAYKEQFDRYLLSLSNIVFTDYLSFRFFRDGLEVAEVAIAHLEQGRVKPMPENFELLRNLITEFGSYVGQTLTSSADLAGMMAQKAKLLSNVILAALLSDEKHASNTELRNQLSAFRNVLIHDIDPKAFADIYAQTIAYGMFAARSQDRAAVAFTRQQAANLIPKSNPFLRKLFQYVSGYDIDSRIEWIVNALADVFRAADMDQILKGFGKTSGKTDPVIHFYEVFLAAYDPALRKARGVWYTPEPVVKFIVSAADYVLRTQFDLASGLADTSKTQVTVRTQGVDKRSKKGLTEALTVHKVQILDPATGTGTFLAEIVRHIHARFKGQAGLWAPYVEANLIPRLNGFELLMASYAMAHLKLDLVFRETGHHRDGNERLRVYLTNSLEEHHPDTGTLFASWLAAEANEANHIKRDTPVMVVLGNPPYSRHSANKGAWMQGLLDAYKLEPRSNARLKERNSKWLNDDYVKFIRYAQYHVEKTGSGIVAYITNHGFIDNPTFRGMRWSLINTFDDIYIVDLHGNSNFSEMSPDGGQDENVFDIKQGVSIIILVRNSASRKGLARIHHFDLYGSRASKYEFLAENDLASIPFEDVEPRAPYFFLRNKSYNETAQYNSWPSLDQIFEKYSTGYYTSCDDIVLDSCRTRLSERIRHQVPGSHFDPEKIRKTAYRPFDPRWIYYEPDLLTRARKKFVDGIPDASVVLLSGKSTRNPQADHFFIADRFAELKCAESTKGSYMFPVRYRSAGHAGLGGGVHSNLAPEVAEAYQQRVGRHITPDEIGFYIYAILSSPLFRTIYDEQLREDFARVPYPDKAETFESLASFGKALFKLHTREDVELPELVTTFPKSGSNEVTKRIVARDSQSQIDPDTVDVWINETQYFGAIPSRAIEFSVGGYKPALKWLKDRQGTTLSFDDILQYQGIVASICHTIQIMADIDIVVTRFLTPPESDEDDAEFDEDCGPRTV